MSNGVSAQVRMYRLDELGDCFLITFVAGSRKTRMLIDCGSFRNGEPSVTRLRKVVGDIRSELGGVPLDVVVGTHQHNDHLSGFVHCEDDFRQIGVKQVWLSWLDNPKDRKAQQIGKEHNNLKLALFHARRQLQDATNARALRSLDVLDDVLGFLGAKDKTPPELPADAVKILKELGEEKPTYLKPGRILDMPGLSAGDVKVYVLGPPRDDELSKPNPRKGESYDHALAAAQAAAGRFLNAVLARAGDGAGKDDVHYPFNDTYKRRGVAPRSAALKPIVDRYRRREDAWRTIDDDWIDQAETLALFLDDFTNNSSLALAIELVKSGKILLFAADAQTGNWRSWSTVKWEVNGVATDDLLARTVFYKVGHHGSHNSTLVQAFEKMTHPDLTAMIPVHKKDPNITKKTNPWKMPAAKLFRRIVEKTSNRVLQMDDKNPPSCDPTKDPARESWRRVKIKPAITPLFIELEFDGQ